jgi:hypothetical protein
MAALQLESTHHKLWAPRRRLDLDIQLADDRSEWRVVTLIAARDG